jgi:aldose 1-epimerase
MTFIFYDAAYQGFPGDVVNLATYTVSPGPRWTSRLVSIPLNKATPIMLSNHVYWNLGAFINKKAQTVLDNELYLPYSQRYVATAIDQVPNGLIKAVAGTYLDFTTPTVIGSQINQTVNNCGVNCTGYNNAFIIDRPRYSAPEATDLTVLTMSSPETGIQLDLRTNMQNLEIFSCNWFNGTIKAKADQQHSNTTSYYELHGCTYINLTWLFKCPLMLS